MNRTISLAAVAAVVAGIGAWYMTSQSSTAQTTSDAAKIGQTKLTTTDSVTMMATEDAADTSGIVEMTLGSDDAPVTVVEYASFTCGHCASFHMDQLQKLKKDYMETGKVKYVYRDVYFDRIGLWASMLARCESPRFFGLVDLLYTKQGEWLKGNDPVAFSRNLKKLGKVAGMDEAKIDACMQDADKAKALVAWFEANRAADDISATPSLIINGKKHSNMSYPELKKVLDAELGQ